MDLLQRFQTSLREKGKSELTIKNYLSDLRRFIGWFEDLSQRPFDPTLVKSEDILKYKQTLSSKLDVLSAKRHSSSLNQFFLYLARTQAIISNNIVIATASAEKHDTLTLFRLKEFRSYLLEHQSSSLTVKNYLADVKQFIDWTEKVLCLNNEEIDQRIFFSNLNSQLLKTYRDRLLSEKQLSPVSINRKLSSLRSYLKFLSKYGLIDQKKYILEIEALSKDHSDFPTEEEYAKLLPLDQHSDANADSIGANASSNSPSYSWFPPLRIVQKLSNVGYLISEHLIIIPLAETFLVCQKAIWKLTGGRIFYKASQKKLRRTRLDTLVVDSFEKAFYAPLSVSFAQLPLSKRLFLLLRYKRPNWYKKYHTYSVAHYLHFGILGVIVILMGSLLYERIYPSLSPKVLGSQVLASNRQLQFKGLLVDSDNKAITSQTPLRFALYDDRIASGSSMLWQDIQTVMPDTHGNFSVVLGNNTLIANDIFSSGQSIYLGISIGNSSELKPRQGIPNVHLAYNAERVDGLLPITAHDAGSVNVILALDSAGNLSMKNANPIFQATNGSFTLQGESLVLATLPHTNGNITLSPDGLGVVEITKPIQNTSEYGSIPDTLGSVEVADTFAILATSSATSALTINQNGAGQLVSASSGGTAKFTIDNTGSGYFASNVTLDGTDLATNKPVINVFNRNAQILNIGGEAIAVTIGSQSGTTTIRTPSTNLQGNLTVGGKTGIIFTSENSGITFSGSGGHMFKAESGVLQLGSQLEVGRDVTILPASSEGTNNLGTSTNPFDTLYVNNIVSSFINENGVFWTNANSVLSSLNQSEDIVVGGNSTSSAFWQVLATGSNKGTASSSGNLTFRGLTTSINQLDGGSLRFQTSPGGDEGLTTQLLINPSGYIGVGTTLPLFRLDVQDSRSATATAMITNLETGNNASVLDLKLGTTTILDHTLNQNYFLRFLDKNGSQLGSIQADDTGVFYNGGFYTSSGSDFAEYFLKHDTAENFSPGNIVCLHSKGGVTKCTQEQTSIVGVVSDRPAFVGNASRQHDDSYILVGLQGQVPVLFSDENGPIEPSDWLTISIETPGVAVKALDASPIVGQALEGTTQKNGRVNTYVKAGWYDPRPRVLSSHGDLQLSLQKTQDTDGESHYVLVDEFGTTISETIGNFSEAIIGNLAVGLLRAKDFTAEQAEVSRLLIARLIDAQTIIISDKLVSPIAEIENLRVHVISPLSGKDGLAMIFEKEKIAIVDPVASTTAVLIDKQGNASFSGQLAANSLEVENDATIGGTLRVSRLIADEIQGPKTSSPAATYVTNITNIYTATPAASPTLSSPPLEPSPTPTTVLASSNESTTELSHNSLLTEHLTTEYQPISSFSGALAQTRVSLDFLTVNNGLMVFGPASFADISVSDQIAVGGNLVLADGTINVLGRDLELQSLRQGNLAFMGGLITIDTQGNLIARGNAEFAKDVAVKGKLKANIIAPVPGSDLVMQLNNPDAEDEETLSQHNPGFTVANASGSAVFRVSTLGDLIASGSGRFMQLMTQDLNLMRTAQADTSITQTVASSSAGTATIVRGERERTIVSPFVSEKSLIYLTPTSDTYGVTPYVARQTPEDPGEDSEGSFTIQITRPVLQDINLNWWIIN